MNRNLVVPYAVMKSKDITAEEKVLLSFLSGLSKKDGYCYATDEYLSEECGCSDRTIRRYLKHLVELNIIKIVKKSSNQTRKIFVQFDVIEDSSEDTEKADTGDQELLDKNDQKEKIGHECPKKMDTHDQETGVPTDKIINNNINIKEKEIYKEKESQADTVFISLPLKDGDSFEVSESYVQELISLYPGKAVRDELKLMQGWLMDKPVKDRKTLRGINRFIRSWLTRSNDAPQDRASPKCTADTKSDYFEKIDKLRKEGQEALLLHRAKRNEQARSQQGNAKREY